MLEILLLFLAGLITGIINTLAGGGSLLTLPLLIFMGLDSATANGTNRIGILAQSSFATAGYRSKGVGNWKFSFWMGISASLGALLGSSLAISVDDRLFNRILALVMFVVVGLLIFQPKRVNLTEKATLTGLPFGWALLAFFGIGIYGGFIQAGVGFLILLALTNINRLGLIPANAVKSITVLLYTLPALGVFIFYGYMNWGYGIALAIGGALGSWWASRWSVKKGEGPVKVALLIMVIVMGIKLWLYDH
ncbi:sulfite exporter TauE/SafE family protein [Croceiramulus getboli]|nr:sulfite exporter TauE/SafE family protein [Flavobacteriaceae bacterium YJPT1-3]